MKIDRFGRRRFLQGAGGACLALPLLPSLYARSAEAAPRAVPLRFFAIKSYSTQRLVDWYPRFAGNGYQTRPFDPRNGKLDGSTRLTRPLETSSGRHRDGRAYFAHHAPLADLAAGGSVSTILGPKLNRHLPALTLLRGLDFMPDISHNDGGMLGNYAGATVRRAGVEPWPTLDQALAFSPRVYPKTPLGPRSIHLSLSNRNTCSFTDNGVLGAPVIQVQAHTDPQSAFQELFGSLAPELRERRRKLVDRVLGDYRRLRDDTRLAPGDRQALEQHMSLLSHLEDRLAAEPSKSCQAPPEPELGELKSFDAADIQRTAELMIDLAMVAIRCDLTRVVTFDVWKAVGRGMGPNGSDLGYAHNSAKGPRDWHERVHEFGQPEADRQVRAINQWIADEVLGRVLSGLEPIEEQGESYLYRSLVYWGNELGMNHMNYCVPALLAGNAGGRLRSGQYIDYLDWDQPLKMTQENAPLIEGVPHNRLLVTLLQAFGLEPREYERGGQRGYGSYATAGKTASEYPIDYDPGHYGDPLPGLLV